jgi:glyoxylase-like metal-dependent hydrolase (beta-lactamase superfamily II)
MDAIPIPDNAVTALDDVAPGLAGLRILFVNVFGVAVGEGEWVLIDAGLYFSADRIRHWAAEHFGENTRPNSIVLTHGHFDHVGALKDLADGWDVPVYVHPLELPYVTGKEKYPPPDATVGGGLMAAMSPFYPRGPIDVSNHVRALPADGTIPSMPGWRAIHTPGHTPGHVSFFRKDDRILLVGDAFCTTKTESLLASLAIQTPELHGPPAYYTPDWVSARLSVNTLADLEPLALAPGHGKPVSGPETPSLLRKLAADFERIAEPETKKLHTKAPDAGKIQTRKPPISTEDAA